MWLYIVTASILHLLFLKIDEIFVEGKKIVGDFRQLPVGGEAMVFGKQHNPTCIFGQRYVFQVFSKISLSILSSDYEAV